MGLGRKTSSDSEIRFALLPTDKSIIFSCAAKDLGSNQKRIYFLMA